MGLKCQPIPTRLSLIVATDGQKCLTSNDVNSRNCHSDQCFGALLCITDVKVCWAAVAVAGYFFDEVHWISSSNTFSKDASLIAVLDPNNRKTLLDAGYNVGVTTELKAAHGYFLDGWNLIGSKVTSWDGTKPDDLASDILNAFFSYPDNFIDPINRASDDNPNLYWAQDIECDATLGKDDANGSFAGIIAALWAGHHVFQGKIDIFPVVSSSVMKNLKASGKEQLADLVEVQKLVPKLIDPPQKSWNLMSILKENDMIDGFIYEQYGQGGAPTNPTKPSSSVPLAMTPQHAPFNPKVPLPYALMGKYWGEITKKSWPNLPHYDPSGSKNIKFYYNDPNGVLPFKAGAYFADYPKSSGKDSAAALNIKINDYFSPEPQPLFAYNAAVYQYADGGGSRIVDLTTLALADSVKISISLSRDADYSSNSGFYVVQDSAGSVLDPISGQLIAPGEFGYQQAALSSSNRVTNLSKISLSQNGSSSLSMSLNGGFMMAPFAQVTEPGWENTFFSFPAANSDGFAHFRQLSFNSFGMEDMYNGGDQDFNDLIISFQFLDIA